MAPCGCVGSTKYGDELTGKEIGLDLSSLVRCDLMNAQGVITEEIIKGVDEEAAKKLRYPVPDASKHDVASYLSLDALEMVAQNLSWSMGYGGLSKEELVRCDVLAATYLAKCEASGHLRGTEAEAARFEQRGDPTDVTLVTNNSIFNLWP